MIKCLLGPLFGEPILLKSDFSVSFASTFPFKNCVSEPSLALFRRMLHLLLGHLSCLVLQALSVMTFSLFTAHPHTSCFDWEYFHWHFTQIHPGYCPQTSSWLPPQAWAPWSQSPASQGPCWPGSSVSIPRAWCSLLQQVLPDLLDKDHVLLMFS